MGYCKYISVIKAVQSVGKAVEYVENERKTLNPEFSQSVAIQYVSNESKTRNEQWRETVFNSFKDSDESSDKEFFISGINCDVDNAHEQMITAQLMSSKPVVNYAYHAVQSFKEGPGEMSPETAHNIGVRLANELWGNEFMVLVATHLNTDNYHNHFIICSTSPFTGKRYHKCDQSLREMRSKSDELCREYGLTIIDRNKSKGNKSNGERAAEKRGEPTHRDILRNDCDIAIAQSTDWNCFVSNLRKMGYRIGYSNKFIDLKHDGWDRPIRIYFEADKDKSLGREYTKPAIEERIKAMARNGAPKPETEPEQPEPTFYDEEQEFDYKYERAKAKAAEPIHTLPRNEQECKEVNILPNVRRMKFKGKVKKSKRCKGSLMIIYYRITYKLCLRPMPARPNRKKRMSVYMRNEVNKLHKYLDEARFLSQTKIKTVSGLETYRNFALSQTEALAEERRELRNLLRTRRDINEQTDIKTEISEINAKLKILRKNIKLCDDIKFNSEQVRQACDYDSVRELERFNEYDKIGKDRQYNNKTHEYQNRKE